EPRAWNPSRRIRFGAAWQRSAGPRRGHDFRPLAAATVFYYNCSTTPVEHGGMARKPDVTLSELQIALMRVLWQRGESSTTDVAQELADARGLKHTTVATLLTR